MKGDFSKVRCFAHQGFGTHSGDLAEAFEAKEDYNEVLDVTPWLRSKTEGDHHLKLKTDCNNLEVCVFRIFLSVRN